MVRKVGIRPVGPKIDDKKAHRIAHPLEPAVGPFSTPLRLDELAIRVGDIRVRHHDVRGNEDILDPNAPHPAMLHDDPVHPRIAAECPSQLLKQPDKGVDERTGAADHRLDPPLPLEVVDHRVDG